MDHCVFRNFEIKSVYKSLLEGMNNIAHFVTIHEHVTGHERSITGPEYSVDGHILYIVVYVTFKNLTFLDLSARYIYRRHSGVVFGDSHGYPGYHRYLAAVMVFLVASGTDL